MIGSRSPVGAADAAWAPPVNVLPVGDALKNCRLVVLAIPSHAAAAWVGEHASSLHDKVLVDVANPVNPSFATVVSTLAAKAAGRRHTPTAAVPVADAEAEGGLSPAAKATAAAAAVVADDPLASSAEQVAAAMAALQLPATPVVKAFNNVSAYALDEAAAQTPPPTVWVSTDDAGAKAEVLALGRRLGFPVADAGGLTTARTQEATIHRFFDGWVAAVVLSTIIMVLWTVYWSNIFYVEEDFPATVFWFFWLLRPVGDVAAVLLGLTFLPGALAAAVQLATGTSKRPFPAWFGSWLAIRKQIGLMGWWLATLHAIAGALRGVRELGATYDTFTYISFGIIAYGAYTIMTMASNPAVASSMSWSEFKFVFSGLGLLTMALVLVHMGVRIKIMAPHTSAGKNPVSTLFLAFGILGLSAVAMFVCKVPPLSWAIKRVRAK